MALKYWPEIAQKTTLCLLFISLWGIGYSLFQEEVGISSEFIMLCVLFIGAKVVGYLVSLLKCPAILGQMFFGILLRNIGYFDLSESYEKFAAVLRQLALVNIMLPAGLNLDIDVLKSKSLFIILIAILPAVAETLIMLGLCWPILDIPVLWSILMGLILAGVSPSVIFPCLFYLEDNGYGLERGVNTLVVASSTLNDIISIAVYLAFISIIFSKENLTMQILKGPIGFLIGIVFGIFWGIITRIFPDKSDEFVVTLRTLLIGLGSAFICLGSDATGYGSAGALGCIVAALIAAQGWRKEGWKGDNNPVKYNYIILWKFFEPISFGLIGVAVQLNLLKGLVILWLVLFSLVALAGRILCTFGISYLGKFTKEEKIFFALSAIPKATVQATLGPVALDKATTDEEKLNAMNVLVLSVISIVITAPIGAWLILTFGPKLLPHTSSEERLRMQQQNE